MSSLRSSLGKALLIAGSIALSLLLAELCVRVLDLAAALRQAVEVPAWEESAEPDDSAQRAVNAAKRVPHPFAGWTHRPGRSGNNLFGLPSSEGDFRHLRADDFVIGITGGSVALGVSRSGGEALANRLESLRPDLRGRVRVANLALGGYKQPQQLIQVMQMLLLGVPLDAVVNLDGFNELAMGGRDAQRGFHPFLPAERYWTLTLDLSTRSLSPSQLTLAADGLRARERARSLREWARIRPLLGRSELARAALGLMIVRAESAAATAEQQLADSEERVTSAVYEALTDPCTEERLLCTELIADIWSRSSQSLHALAAGSGALYLHFLQPNQYVEGSKTLTSHEKKVAWAPEHPWSRAAAVGYPTLIEKGRELSARGVDYHDLTGLFRQQQDSIYSDTCCHYNDEGYRLVAEAIAESLARALDRSLP